MLSWLRTRNNDARKARELYGAVVTQARCPAFYRDYGIPDTMAGRYEMISAVLFQVLERLRVGGAATEELSRVALETFFTDVDDSMREIGIGDMSVPKKVKRAAAGFYERAVAYRAALDANDAGALAQAIARFVSEQDAADAGSEALARHMLAQRDALARATLDDVAAGQAFVAPQPVTQQLRASGDQQ